MNDSSFVKLDKIDRHILRILQADGRMSNAELARQINLSQPAVYNRVKRLERWGVIRQYTALVDRDTLDYDLLCFIHVTIQVHDPDKVFAFREAVIELPQVLECYHLTGEYDYLLKVIIRNREDLEHFVVNQMTNIPGADRIRTSIVLSEVKHTTELPI